MLFVAAAGVAGCARPNVILIVADTLRADHLGCYGYERATSPRIDDWARTGTRFTRAHATASWTTPSVISMLTGLYPAAHGVEAGTAVLSERVPTMAEAFRATGYQTAAFSANPGFVTPVNGIGRGFDDFTVLVGPGATCCPGPTLKMIPVTPDLKSWAHVAEADLVTDEAVRFMRKRPGAQPFFLYLHYIDPHADYFPPGEYRTRFGVSADSPLLSEYQRQVTSPFSPAPSESDLETLVALYDGEVAFLSHEIGRLLDAIERLAPNTLVIFTADHGEEFGEHGGVQHGTTLWEEQLHVPLIVSGPGVPAGMEVTAPVSLASLWPTIAELAGVDAPPNLIGASLTPFMRDEAPRNPPTLFADLDRPYTGSEWWLERQKPVHRHAILSMPWKLVEARNGTQRLFDLLADPSEREDVRKQQRDLSRVLASGLRTRNMAAAEMRRAAAPGDEPLTPERRARLRALGYLY